MHRERLNESQLVLSCWKEIASYLGKGVRTVQRWEQEWDLPVRRPNGSSVKGPVAARPEDLDRWISLRWSERDSQGNHVRGSFIAGARVVNKSQVVQTPPAKREAGVELLIQSSRNLRVQNRALMDDLSKSVKALRSICAKLEGQLGRDMGQHLTEGRPLESQFSSMDGDARHEQRRSV